MAPRDTSKATPKLQRTISKNSRPKASTVNSTSSKMSEKTPLKVNNCSIEPRQRTKTNPTSIPKPKGNNSVPLPETVSKSAKKPSWMRRPKPAHSGVPVPEKMKKYFEKHLINADCSF